jgi:hypothetical protein
MKKDKLEVLIKLRLYFIHVLNVNTNGIKIEKYKKLKIISCKFTIFNCINSYYLLKYLHKIPLKIIIIETIDFLSIFIIFILTQIYNFL